MTERKKKIIAVGITLMASALVAWQRAALPGREAAAEFHAAARLAMETIPREAGNWHGTDVRVTDAATKLLKPNILHQRRWTNDLAHETVDVLLVHCGDSRDMLGHYPPNCYPGQGWQHLSDKAWTAGGRADLIEYEFIMTHGSQVGGIFVRDAMLLPGVGLGRDMNDVLRSTNDVRRRSMGAAQLQLVFWHDIPEERRTAITADMWDIYEPVLKRIESGLAVGEMPGVPGTEKGGNQP